MLQDEVLNSQGAKWQLLMTVFNSAEAKSKKSWHFISGVQKFSKNIEVNSEF